MPLFSIIIPIYNIELYLHKCLDSVKKQTFTDWEAICIDDGSTDSSSSILDKYKATDSRFHVIHQENKGVGEARNKGVELAKGEWILFLDGDDVWCYELLTKVESMIKMHPKEKLFRFEYKKFENKFINNICKSEDNYVIIDITKEIMMHDFFSYYFWCYVYNKTLFEGIKFPKYIRGEDRYVLSQILLKRVNYIVATDVILYGYRCRLGSAMSSTPTYQVFCDEMDHRLDIMDMIDSSEKNVEYAKDEWLESYFTTGFYCIANSKSIDREEMISAWQKRLYRLRYLKGLSYYGKFVAWSCSIIHLFLWDTLVCYAIPRLLNGGRPINLLKRRLNIMLGKK